MVMQPRRNNPSGYFNVDAPAPPMARCSSAAPPGNRFETVAPVSGDYLVRVYLMRNAARRNGWRATTCRCGPAPAGKAAASDARGGGHALPRHRVDPLHAGRRQSTTCGAGVIRRRAGAGTVRITLPGGAVRHVALPTARPCHPDSPAGLEVERAGDTSVITLGSGDRFEIPDALVTGG